MKRPAVVLALAFVATARAGPAPRTRVRILAFSDYHSHAVPFRSEGRPDQGGLARAIALIKRARADGPTLVLSGGDMLNKGVPVWSDEYGCVEWPWLDGLVDAMALGNHDLDYGPEAFAACRASTRVPVLSANLLAADARPFLAVDGRPYLVRVIGGVRIGAFALAGPDVQRLIRPANLPPGTRWADAVETARAIVKTLREQERVQAVVFFGHQAREDDEAMARAVPGIDLVLGTHSHHKSGLATIPGTDTRTLAPYQYLAYVSDVRLAFQGGRLVGVEGALVPLDPSQPEDPAVAARVEELQRQLRARRPERFALVGRAAVELSDAGLTEGESLIGNWATEVLRRRAGAHVFFSTASSFRGGLPPGPLMLEDLYAAVPYPNRIAVARLRGAQLLEWLSLSVSRRGSDLFSQLSGARYSVRDGRPAEVQVLDDPAAPEKGYAPLDPAGRYVVATTDYQGGFVEGYRQIFAAGESARVTDVDVHATLLDALARAPADARLDGRTLSEGAIH
jgi:5'-nucleotidase/UDP-sugar diphosphatase